MRRIVLALVILAQLILGATYPVDGEPTQTSFGVTVAEPTAYLTTTALAVALALAALAPSKRELAGRPPALALSKCRIASGRDRGVRPYTLACSRLLAAPASAASPSCSRTGTGAVHFTTAAAQVSPAPKATIPRCAPG